jgi:5,10-methylenetetrahydromethanopterin reductase
VSAAVTAHVPLRASIRLNNDVDAATYLELVAAAEDAGFDQVWLSHDLFLRSAPVLIALAAARTHRISLGAGILNPYSVHPAELAMTAATLREVSGGRFLLGLGAGADEFLGWAGIARPEPLGRTREAVVAVRTLLAGGRPSDRTDAGPGWDPAAHLRFTAGPVPIYVGAMGPRMTVLAGEVGDGALPLLLPPERWDEVVPLIAEGRAASDRDAFDLPACVWVAVDDEPERARAVLAGKLAYYGAALAPNLLGRVGVRPDQLAPVAAALRAGDTAAAVAALPPSLLRLGIAGDPTEVVARCRGLVDAGATHVSFGPPLGPDPVAAVVRLAREVLPELRAAAVRDAGREEGRHG